MVFIPAVTPPEKCIEQSFCFIIRHQEIIVKPDQDRFLIPTEADILGLFLDREHAHFIGLWDGHCCYAIDCPIDLSLPEALHFLPLREAFLQFSPAGVHSTILASQVITWDKTFRFCGQCGQPTTELPKERAKVCNGCGLTNYPRLSPSIIVSVIRDKSILLGRSPRFPNGMYSVLAGFVEPGETLEECVQREIREEVGIEVKNIRYFGSQNWPFPHSMMIGFTADYSAGEIRVDNEEIVEAKWFKADEVPKLPGSYSIARRMIDHFIHNSPQEKQASRGEISQFYGSNNKNIS